MNSRKWFWFAILFQNIFAYVVCLCFYQIGSFVTGGAFGFGTVVGFVVLIVMLFLLFRPDPYKDQKVYSKTFCTGIIKKCNNKGAGYRDVSGLCLIRKPMTGST